MTLASAPRWPAAGSTGPKRRTDLVLMICVAFLATLVVAALAAPILPISDPFQLNFTEALNGPSAAHLLGTDASGRDILSRVIWGTRVALLGPLYVVVLSTVLGTAVSLIAAWFGGIIDSIIGRVLDIIFAFPGVLLAILSVAIFGKGIVAPVLAMSLAYIPYIARVVRQAAISERRKTYIAAYAIQGFSATFALTRGVLPNIFPTVMVQATLIFGYALLDLAALSFLGLGVQPPAADWGYMISENQSAIIQGNPLPSLIPAFLIVLTVVAFTLIGQKLGERVEGR